MLDRFERPIKIVCLAMAALVVFQLAGLILRGDPLAHVKIPALPVLTAVATNEPAKVVTKATNATNSASATNKVQSTNAVAKSTNAPGAGPKPGAPEGMPNLPPGLPPEIMAQIMAGGMPGGPGGAPMKKMELPPEIKARLDEIVDSEIFGPVMHPMPMALIGIADEEAFIQATNGQTGPIKLGGEMGGIKLLRIGVNRVLVEQNGEKKELTIFGGKGGESLMPKPDHAPSTNASTNLTALLKHKETH